MKFSTIIENKRWAFCYSENLTGYLHAPAELNSQIHPCYKNKLQCCCNTAHSNSCIYMAPPNPGIDKARHYSDRQVDNSRMVNLKIKVILKL